MSVYIVGAGPGDPGLLTLRARELLESAEVVIYDRLVSEGILAMIPDNALRIDAGKSSGSHKISQSEIENLLIEYARLGKRVIRLKGGDPFLFGRGGEEAQSLINAGVDFEIVPGVSSALAVPEYAGIPVTHREFCSGVNIFTAHDKNNLLPDFSNTTSVFLMGVANSELLQAKLLASGLEGSTPCAVIQDGTTSRQRVIHAELNSLHEAIVTNSIRPPAVILVGGTAGLNLDWRNRLLLHDKRVLITRPAGRSEYLSRLLREAGAEVISMPAIKTSTLINALDGESLSGYDWVGFTSVTGVNALFELLGASGRDVRELECAKVAAIGPATAEALRSHGLRVDFVPEIYDGRHLAEGLLNSGKVLMFRAFEGSPEIAEVFNSNGINHHEICLYRIEPVKLAHVPDFIDIIIFTSASTVRGFCSSVSVRDMRGVNAVCIGSQTADEAVRLGFVNVTVAERATPDAIFEAVMSLKSGRK
ncbi:MAG: uroporphyrinogen-III C-methyltransferase [Synergistaceae bacterium]|nr:uroporphyrinogen-III C-methyltransferase [Synergistaceae bacterium]